MKKDVIPYDAIIIGAGLSGLTTAYKLRETGLHVLILEARQRVGGRILTSTLDNHAPLEMGATWLGSKHSYLVNLLDELKVFTFEQRIGDRAIYEAISTSPHYLAQIPPNPEPTLRIGGGTEKIIKALRNAISEDTIHLGVQVLSITTDGEYLTLGSDNGTYKAKSVVSTLPPNLLVSNIDFNNKLPKEVIQIAKNTHTWMGESIKIALTYDTPFWRADHLSGTIMSNVGPIPEMYDHSDVKDERFALMGFLNGGYFQLSKEERLSLILNQLQKYYGEQARSYTRYEEKVWKNEAFTYAPYDSHVLPHQLNGHEIYQKRYLEDNLIISGTETSPHYPGYMEGAVYSGINAANMILKDIEVNQ